MKLFQINYGALMSTPSGMGMFVGAFHEGQDTQVLVQFEKIDPLTEKPQIVSFPIDQVQVVDMWPVEA